MAINPADHAFHFEARKAGFAQTNSGTFLRLQLDPVDIPPELMSAIQNQRFFIVMTPMPDDMPEPTKSELEDGDRAVSLAGMMCKDKDFQRAWDCRTEAEMADQLRLQLGVKSRKELKSNPAARKRLYAIHSKHFLADTL